MSNPAIGAPAPRKTRKPSQALKLDRKKVLELHQKGLNASEIARYEGVSPSTVWRFLERSKPQQEALERFKTGRADILADLQARSLNVQGRILESLDQDRVVEALTPHQKTGLIAVLSAQHGTLYDKERLEKGKSTANLSLMSRLMGEAFERVGKTLSLSTPTVEESASES